MPLRRTKRSNGRQRPRWKDGSHELVENTHANESRCDEIALEPNRQTEPLVSALQLLKRSREEYVSTRDRLARTGAGARIEESAANGEVRLALRPYGRKYKLRSGFTLGYGGYVKSLRGPAAGRFQGVPAVRCARIGLRWTSLRCGPAGNRGARRTGSWGPGCGVERRRCRVWRATVSRGCGGYGSS
jgi:hypothetical protein